MAAVKTGPRLTIRLTEQQDGDLKRVARRELLTCSAVARRLIVAGLKRELRAKSGVERLAEGDPA